MRSYLDHSLLGLSLLQCSDGRLGGVEFDKGYGLIVALEAAVRAKASLVCRRVGLWIRQRECLMDRRGYLYVCGHVFFLVN